MNSPIHLRPHPQIPPVGEASEVCNWINSDLTHSRIEDGFKRVLGCLGRGLNFHLPLGILCRIQGPPALASCLRRICRSSVECAYQLCRRIYALISPCEASLTGAIMLSIICWGAPWITSLMLQNASHPHILSSLLLPIFLRLSLLIYPLTYAQFLDYL